MTIVTLKRFLRQHETSVPGSSGWLQLKRTLTLTFFNAKLFTLYARPTPTFDILQIPRCYPHRGRPRTSSVKLQHVEEAPEQPTVKFLRRVVPHAKTRMKCSKPKKSFRYRHPGVLAYVGRRQCSPKYTRVFGVLCCSLLQRALG